MTRSARKPHGDCRAGTELRRFPDRGHRPAIDHGRPIVAGHVMRWPARRGINGEDTSYA